MHSNHDNQQPDARTASDLEGERHVNTDWDDDTPDWVLDAPIPFRLSEPT